VHLIKDQQLFIKNLENWSKKAEKGVFLLLFEVFYSTVQNKSRPLAKAALPV
jgi:hypothetical protein